MKVEIVFVLRVEPYHSKAGDPPSYVQDICAHDYTTCFWQTQAKEWSSEAELAAELAAAEVTGDFEIVKVVRCQAGTF